MKISKTTVSLFDQCINAPPIFIFFGVLNPSTFLESYYGEPLLGVDLGSRFQRQRSWDFQNIRSDEFLQSNHVSCRNRFLDWKPSRLHSLQVKLNAYPGLSSALIYHYLIAPQNHQETPLALSKLLKPCSSGLLVRSSLSLDLQHTNR